MVGLPGSVQPIEEGRTRGVHDPTRRVAELGVLTERGCEATIGTGALLYCEFDRA